MQRAALEIERGLSLRAVGELLGVSHEAIRKWQKHPDWPSYMGTAKVMLRQSAAESARGVIVPIRPGVASAANDGDDGEEPTTPETLLRDAMAAVHAAVKMGNAQAATWVLERVDPSRFGTVKDRIAMAELQKAAADVAPRKVTVTVSAPVKRKAESA